MLLVRPWGLFGVRVRGEAVKVMSPVAVGATTLLLAAACAGPFIFAAQPYVLHVLTLALCYAIPAIAVNLLFGYSGLVSLGHMGFAGVGAYTTALLMKSAGWPFSTPCSTISIGSPAAPRACRASRARSRSISASG
jgi:ABC-type branched-subunit amino acid transport system permease subunit